MFELGRWDTLAMRLTIFLTIGGTVSAVSSLTLAEAYRQKQMRTYRAERVTASVKGLVHLLETAPERTRRELAGDRVQGAHLLPDKAAPRREVDPYITSALGRAFGPQRVIAAFRSDAEICIGHPENHYVRRADGYLHTVPECWVIAIERAGVLGIDLAPLPRPDSMGLSPGFILIVTGAALVLSFLVAQITLGFMRRLTRAAQAFATDMDADPVPETGPRDVRETFAAFNLMQQRIREAMRERAHILAAISHDLQTPLTRLLLRLELVSDDALRKRLVGDVAPLEIRVKPEALHRCLQNLVDNALRYGGSARLDCFVREGAVHIAVRDCGPGIAPERIERMFKPFVRGEESRSRATGGTGIGLTIARAQAATFGAHVTLANAPEGGLIATISVPMA